MSKSDVVIKIFSQVNLSLSPINFCTCDIQIVYKTIKVKNEHYINLSFNRMDLCSIKFILIRALFNCLFKSLGFAKPAKAIAFEFAFADLVFCATDAILIVLMPEKIKLKLNEIFVFINHII
uniref:CSON006242 protein n=1 Tax=Culicoides sonorensis TaxID=179676 RepID=A0A336LZK6_CULSO